MPKRLGPWFGPPMEFAEHWECSNEEYHASPGTSKSMLKTFLEDPELFQGYYVSRTIPLPKQTPAQKFGTDIHDLILDRNGVGASAVLIPDDILKSNGAIGTKAYKAFAAEHPGKYLIKRNSPEDVIIQNVKRHPKAMAILEGVIEFEYSIRATDPLTGLLLRCREDCWSRICLMDVKTTFDPSPEAFKREIKKNGYHRQGWLYRNLHFLLTGEYLPFSFVAIRAKPPHRVEVYSLSDAFLALGGEEVKEATQRLARCFEDNDWSSTTEGQIVELDPPGYRGREQQQPEIEFGEYDGEGTDPADDESESDEPGAAKYWRSVT